MTKETDSSNKTHDSDAEMYANAAKRYANKALRQINEAHIFESLDLSNLEDQGLFVICFTERAIRTNIYDSSYLLSHPVVAVALKIPGFNRMIKLFDWIDKQERKKLASVEAVKDLHIEKNYTTPEARNRARTIELSANDLVGQSLTENKDRTETKIVLMDDTVRSWAERWKSTLERSEKHRSTSANGE